MADATLNEAVKKQLAAESLASQDDDTDTGDTQTVSEEGSDVTPAAQEEAAPNLGYTFTPVTAESVGMPPEAAQSAQPAAQDGRFEPSPFEPIAESAAQPPQKYILNPATGSYEPVQTTQPPLGTEAERAALQQAGQYAGTRDVLTPETAADYGLSSEGGFISPAFVAAAQAQNAPPEAPVAYQPTTPAEQVAQEEAARYAGEQTPLTPQGLPAYPEAPREPEVRRAELVRLPPSGVSEEGLPVYPTPPAVRRAEPVTRAFGQGAQITEEGLPVYPTPPAVQPAGAVARPGYTFVPVQPTAQPTQPTAPTTAPIPPVVAGTGIKPLTADEAREQPIDIASNGYTAGRNQPIRNVILHSTDGSEKSDVPTLTQSGKVGVQYYVTKDGRVMHFVSDGDSAWQAGKDKYGNNANPYTIGIEQEHVDGKEAWPDAQVRATAKVAAGILLRNPQLSLSDVVGHSDIAGERKQDPVAYPWEHFRGYVQAYMGQGAAPGTPAQVAEKGAPQAQPATKGANGFYANEKPEDFLTGKATTFATPQDIASGQDNGRGAAHVGGLDTTQVSGLAIPEAALRARYGNNYAAWRTARVDVVDPQTGQRLRVPIVDLGPRGDLSAIADMTPSLSRYFGGDKNLSFKLVDNAGPDVTKNPQLFADEQAAIRQGVDSSALVPGVAKVQGYSFKPITADEAAQAQQAVQAGVQRQQDALTKLPEAGSGNIIGLYKRLDQPIEGVSSQVAQQTQANLKPQIIAAMREKFPELKTDDDAWAKATSDVNALDVSREWISKAIGYGQQFTNVLQKGVAGTDQLHVNRFLDSAMPGASDADKHAYLAKLYAMPIDQQVAEISSKLPQPQAGIPSTDPQQIISALTRLSDPGFQKQQATDLANAKAEMQRNISDDPRLKGTFMERIVNDTAQMPAVIAAMSNPVMWPAAMAQVSDQVREGFAKEHPEWDQKTLEQNTARATLVQFFGQAAANELFVRGVGTAFSGIESPTKRMIAQAIATAGGSTAIAAGTQAGTNIVTGQPIGAGVGEAAITGAIQGAIPGIVHGLGERIQAPERATPERAPVTEEPAVTPPPVRQPVTAAGVLGPEVSENVPWYRPGPIVTRGTERTAFTPEELVRATANLPENATPEELRAAVEALQPPLNFINREAFLNTTEAQQAEVALGQAAQRPVGQVDLEQAIQEQQIRQAMEAQAGNVPQNIAPRAQAAPPKGGVGEAEPWVSKIANRFTVERMANGELGSVEPGHGFTKEEMLAQGLRMGPEEINQHVSNVNNNVGGDPKAQAAAIRAEEARLSRRSHDASVLSEANPGDPQARAAADEAFKDLTDFHNGPVAKLKNDWHAQGMTLQGEIPVDLSTFNGLREAFLRDVGKPAPEAMEPVMRQTAQRVREASMAETAAMQKLGAEIEKQTAGRILPTAEQVRNNIMSRMKVEPCPT